MILHIEVKPNAKRNEIIYLGENTLKLKIRVPATEGKANQAIVEFLSEVFNTSKSKVEILKGTTSTYKKIKIDLNEAHINEVLEKYK
ncbi:MAG: YggU family protein [Flavobacteriales bacterium]|nr:YggU family protein [Flavobacteriales bacterium]